MGRLIMGFSGRETRKMGLWRDISCGAKEKSQELAEWKVWKRRNKGKRDIIVLADLLMGAFDASFYLLC